MSARHHSLLVSSCASIHVSLMLVQEKCAERARLAGAVARAVKDMCARSREYRDAVDRKEIPKQIGANLTTAHDLERDAVYAYDDHIKNHSCKG